MKLHLVFAALTTFLSAPMCGAEERLMPVYDAALSGDGIKAMAELSSIDTSTLDPDETSRAACVRKALLSPPEGEALPEVPDNILRAYRTYWQASMMRQVSRAEAEAQLTQRLNAIVMARNPRYVASGDIDVASEAAKHAIEQEGLFALAGITSPYYELAIWKTQSERTYTVDLLDRRVRTKVIFMDDFVSLGWAGFASCDRFHTAGWATDTALFAVKSAYDLKSEDFRVSYLAHESRHFSDYRRFPRLEQAELEYRAKLTELSLARKSAHDLITTFSRRVGRDRSVPHDFANYWLSSKLSRAVFKSASPIDDPAAWRKVPAKVIRQAARRLLSANDAYLDRNGPSRVERFLGD